MTLVENLTMLSACLTDKGGLIVVVTRNLEAIGILSAIKPEHDSLLAAGYHWELGMEGPSIRKGS